MNEDDAWNKVYGFSQAAKDAALVAAVWKANDERNKAVKQPPNYSYERNPDRCPECGEFGHNCDPDGVGHYRG